jgi:predicted short-subunit dehydrogenase-like oxidoreductase (DUF2520 family)
VIARTPNTFIVGAGPVATALAGGLRLGGVPVLGLWARTPAAARQAGGISGIAAFSAAPPDLLLEADVVILAVRDRAISEVAQKLCATGLVTTKHVLLHCSGAMSAEEAFLAVKSKIGGIGTMHPLRAISDPRRTMREFKGTVFGVEGDELGLRSAQALIKALGGQPLELSSNQVTTYHAAAALASNYVIALMDAATEILRASGLDENATRALLPLMEGTLENLREQGIEGALTGPIRRGDKETVARHLEALDKTAPNAAALYRELGLRTVAIARRIEGVDVSLLDAIEALLLKPASGRRRLLSAE